MTGKALDTLGDYQCLYGIRVMHLVAVRASGGYETVFDYVFGSGSERIDYAVNVVKSAGFRGESAGKVAEKVSKVVEKIAESCHCCEYQSPKLLNFCYV